MSQIYKNLFTWQHLAAALWPQKKVWVQRAYTTATHVALAVRFPQQTAVLYLARGGISPTAGLIPRLPPPALRLQDRFLDYIRAFVRGCSLQAPYLDTHDCILGLPLQHGLAARLFLLFWRGRELYFMGGEIAAPSSSGPKKNGASNLVFAEQGLTAVIFCSWLRQKRHVPVAQAISPEHFLKDAHQVLWDLMLAQCDLIGRASQAVDPRWCIVMPSAEVEKLEAKLFTLPAPITPEVAPPASSSLEGPCPEGISLAQKTAIKFLRKKIKNIEQDLASLKKWRFFFDLLQRPDFTPPEEDRWTKEGVTFKFQGRVGHQKIDYIYQKIKRWKAAEQLQVKRLEECHAELKAVLTNSSSVQEQNIIVPMWADRWEKLQRKASPAAPKSREDAFLDCRRFKGPQEVIFYLGKNAAANDRLRHMAKKEDWWVHLENYPSAHIYFAGKLEPRIELLTALASLLRDNAHLNIQEIPIIYTKVKNLKAIKGQAGGVLFKKEKHLRLPYQAWQDLLQEI
jgi:hypothetical protein